ncbi:uncharacterized protein BYT42DRAFT_46157 [Radiomyces spectabilis]|uniref:uncharacterized protein n=1 Tax=Radiomyces spectabilis TaxID=64574 RepID=UPI0022207465|nr:uncharacterized protein BYT42DRAFT_46157 [Radiomyces spectabilis]KAI8372794.1 hypothetical protein BYT42DRAFT_46157 [Radiomyces spectabilis]
MRCRCGSTNHQRVSSSRCPLNPRNTAAEQVIQEPQYITEQVIQGPQQIEVSSQYHTRCCQCGRTDHQRITSSRCPLTPANSMADFIQLTPQVTSVP